MFSGLTKKTCNIVMVINNERIVSSMLAGNISHFIAIEFLSQITNMRTRIRNVCTYM